MIEARCVCVNYGGLNALNNVSLTMRDGEFTAVLGANGAGKSTLLKVLTGFLRPSSGEVFFGGKPLREISARGLALRRSVLEQEAHSEFDCTVFEMLSFGGFARGGVFCAAPGEGGRICAALEKVGLSGAEDRKYSELSGGQKRRVQLARAIFQLEDGGDMAGKGLFLDEPSAGLDPSHAHCAMRAVGEMCARGVSVFAVLHDPNLALAYADKCLLLKGGEPFMFGRAEEVLTAQNLSEIYDSECEEVFTARGKFVVFPGKGTSRRA